MSDTSSVSDGVKSDDGSAPHRNVPRVKGGSGGVAALIQAQKRQSGGLKELGKVPVSKESRALKTMSTVVPGSKANPVPKPSRTNRLNSVPDNYASSNGSVPSKTALLPPGGVARSISCSPSVPNSDGGGGGEEADIAPPKPPRTGSTSPSAFLEGEGEEGDEWDMCEDREVEEMYGEGAEGEERDLSGSSNEASGYYEVKKETPSPKRPMRPPSGRSSKSRSTSPSPATVRKASKDEGGRSPKIPLLPPAHVTSRTPPTPSKAMSPSSKTPPTPTKTPPITRQSPKPLPPRPGSKSRDSMHSSSDLNHSHSGSNLQGMNRSYSNSGSEEPEVFEQEQVMDQSHSSSNFSDSKEMALKKENEQLKQELELMKQRLQKSQVPAQNGSLAEPNIPDPLAVSQGEEFRSRSRSTSPGDEEERDRFPSGQVKQAKPVPVPRMRAMTVAAASSSRKINVGHGGASSRQPTAISPSTSVPTTVGFVTPTTLTDSQPPSDVKRSQQKTTPTHASSAEKSPPKRPMLPPGSGSPVPKPRNKIPSSDSPIVERRSIADDSSSKKPPTALSSKGRSDSKSSDKSSEKAKAAITLQKLLPGGSGSKVPLLPPGKSQASPAQKEKETKVTSPTVSSPTLIQSPTSSAPKSIPIPKSVVASHSRSRTEPDSDLSSSTSASTTKDLSSSQSLNPSSVPVSSPLSKSVPPLTSIAPDIKNAVSPSRIVKAPLNSVANPIASAGGKAKYKKVTLGDSSWIKRKESLGSPGPDQADGSIVDSVQEKPTQPSTAAQAPKSPSRPVPKPAIVPRSSGPNASGAASKGSTTAAAATTASGSSAPSPAPSPQPYRSHPILSGPKSVQQPFIPPPSPEPSSSGKAAASGKKSPNVSDQRLEVSEGKAGKKWGKTASDGVSKSKPTRRFSFNRSTSTGHDEVPPLPANKGKGGWFGRKTSSQAQIADSSKQKSALKVPMDPRPASVMVDTERKPEFSASYSSLPRGVAAEEAMKQQKQKKGFFGRKTKTTYQKHEDVPSVSPHKMSNNYFLIQVRPTQHVPNNNFRFNSMLRHF